MKEQHNVKFLLHRREKNVRTRINVVIFVSPGLKINLTYKEKHDANEIKSKKANNQPQRIL